MRQIVTPLQHTISSLSQSKLSAASKTVSQTPAKEAPKAQTTGNLDRIEIIKAKIFEHRAVNHPYLKALAEGTLPNMREAIRDYALQYRGYSEFFIKYVELLMEQLPERQRVLLQENLEEEIGHVYDAELTNAGIDPEWVRGIRHTVLFDNFRATIGITKEMIQSAEYIPVVTEWRDQMLKLCSDRALGVGALGLGTELLVPTVYQNFLRAIQATFPELKPRDYVFFPLHIFCDDDHSLTLINMAKELIADGREQEVMTGCRLALAYREQFWDQMLQRALSMPPADNQKSIVPREADKLYDSQANNWARVEPVCLSDFTARPKVLYDLCGDLTGKSVLDIGCGDGYCTRILAERGAKSVVGMDISEKMIEAAKTQETRNPLGIKYFAANATDLKTALRQNSHAEQFDLVVAVFLFNYVNYEQMLSIMKQAYGLLSPGGQFVFSVPHPAFPFWKRPGSTDGFPFVFNMDAQQSSAYFDARDQLFQGRIWRKDGKELHVQLVHKTLEDYFTCLRSAGFVDSLPILQELHADAKLQERMPEFVGNLKGIPLHLGFSVQKASGDFDATISTEVLERQFAWSGDVDHSKSVVHVSTELMDEFTQFIVPLLPLDVETLQLYSDNNQLVARPSGIMNATYHLGNGKLLISEQLNNHLVELGRRLRDSLSFANEGLGYMHLKGFNVDRVSDANLQENFLSVFYYLVSIYACDSLVAKRGRLYDVIDRGLDINGEDVLFSATRARSSFHTDSTDRHVFPDAVGLACIHQCQKAEQGHLELVNAANVFLDLPIKHAKALQEPIVRDLIDKGMGNTGPKAIDRLLNNRFPVFAKTEKSPITFRYMRFWIEKGFEKTGLPMTSGLLAALDRLDQQLEHCESRIRVRLERGEIIWCNNHVLAHNRDAFDDLPGHPKRHMKRAWLRFDA